MDGEKFTMFNTTFTAKEDVGTGANIGFFCIGTQLNASEGCFEIDWFRIFYK
jgi:hypothetical protein